MTVATQSVQVTGDSSQVFAAGRDVVVTDTYVQQKTDFFAPNLASLKETIAPQITPRLAKLARQQRLLVLGGQFEDKAMIARHVAWYLVEIMRSEAAASNGHSPDVHETPILQWNQSPDARNLIESIEQETTPTIFLLPNILPQHVSYDLDRIHNVAHSGHHHIIITTDRPLPSWKLIESEKRFWQELNPHELFSVDDLLTVLVDQLESAEATLHPGIFIENYELDQSLIGGMRLRTIAAQLGTPNNVVFFMQLLRRETGLLDEKAVEALIKLATDNRRTVEKWYHTVLQPHEQFLALSLSIFDGLFDDQFFGALEQLVLHIRNYRDSTLSSFDYCDIDNLRNFFYQADLGSDGAKYESRLSDQRLHVFKAAWESHRRLILHAIPVAVRLTKQSVDNGPKDWELFGTYQRRDQLRHAIGDALSDIGLISVTAVEPALLQLASERHLGVQSVAARALARWREYNDDTYHGDAKLFATLERWQHEARVLEIVETLLAGQESDKRQSPLAVIRSTVALTVSYAAGYDPPNNLGEALQNLIRQLAADHHTIVRDRFRWYTLPRVVSLHPVQMRDILHEMTRYIDLTEAIGASLAFAYANKTNTGEVLRTLELWHQECDQTKPASMDSEWLTQRDKLLITLTSAYGEIEYDDRPAGLTVDEGFKRLRNILADERHPKIRGAVFKAIKRQSEHHFDDVEPVLRTLVAEVTEDERVEIVQILTKIYLEQRKQLPNGPAQMQFNDQEYPVWIDAPRPLTAVEAAMLRWIKGSDCPVAQQIATQAFIAFAQQLEQVEAKSIDLLQQHREQATDRDAAAETPSSPARVARAQPGWYTTTLVPLLATFGNKRYRPIIRGLLPEALRQHKAHQDVLNFVLDKWQKISDIELDANAQQHTPGIEVKIIAQRLRSAISWHQSAGILLAIIAVIGLCLACGILNAAVS